MSMTLWQWLQVATAASGLGRRWLRWRRDRRCAAFERAARGFYDLTENTTATTETEKTP